MNDDEIYAPPSHKKQLSTEQWFWIIALLLLGVVGIVLFQFLRGGSPITLPTLPTPGPQAQALVNGPVIVNPRTVQAFRFEVNEQMQAVTVQGEFRAQGGDNNDIIVTIVSATDYTNIINGSTPISPLYITPQVTADNLTVSITQPGVYYVIFDNRFSIVSNKVVTAQLSLIYQ